ncbi:MAG: hypothetical protein JJP05_01515 [cyanobacterium endosymbiont of Rhopalodia gibba]
MKLAFLGFHGELVGYLGEEVEPRVEGVSKSFFCFWRDSKGREFWEDLEAIGLFETKESRSMGSHEACL